MGGYLKNCKKLRLNARIQNFYPLSIKAVFRIKMSEKRLFQLFTDKLGKG
jgi:hypothetical protein